MKGQLIETNKGWRIASQNNCYKLIWGLDQKLDEAINQGYALPDWVEFDLSKIYRNTVNRIVTADI